MVSSVGGAAEAVRTLAAYLTGTEAKDLADRIEDGDPLSIVLGAVPETRREQVGELLARAGVGPMDAIGSARLLRAIEGANLRTPYATPIWTLPGNLAERGHLTSQMSTLVMSARESVTCATYNFARSSALWDALAAVSLRPEVAIRLYLDTAAADHPSPGWRGVVTTTDDVATALPRLTLLRTRVADGRPFRSHTKFLAIDHRTLVVTSANFSASAERHNVEMGIVLDDPRLTESVERQMAAAEDVIYERVLPHGRGPGAHEDSGPDAPVRDVP